MKSIIFFIGQLSGGGAERQCIMQANTLVDNDFLVKIVALFSTPSGSLPVTIDPRIQVISISNCEASQLRRSSKIRVLLCAVKKIRSLLKTGSVLYCWLETCHLIGFFSALFTKARCVWAIRSSSVINQMSRYMRSVIWINRYLSLSTQLAIFNSTVGQSYYVEHLGYSLKRTAVVYNFFDFSKFMPYDNASIIELRKRYEIQEDIKVILSLSRLVPEKNIPFLFRSVSLLDQDTKSKIKLLVVGSGKPNFCHELKLYAKKLGLEKEIVWVGAIKNTVDFYNMSDLFVLAAKGHEGVSNALLEAVACGCPVAITDAGDNAKFVQDKDLIFSEQMLAKKIKEVVAGDIKPNVGMAEKYKVLLNDKLQLISLFNSV